MGKSFVILSEGVRDASFSNKGWPSLSRILPVGNGQDGIAEGDPLGRGFAGANRVNDLVSSFRMIAKGGWVYMMSSHSRCLYIGVTSDLGSRVWEHKNGVYPGFTKKYKINLLIYYELFHDIEDAIAQRNN